MPASVQAAQDPVIARIIALLRAARPQLQADAKAMNRASSGEPYGPGEAYIDEGIAIGTMRSHVQSLRASVLRQAGGTPAAANAKELTAQTLLEFDQSLEKLAQSIDAEDPATATALRDESVRLLSQAAVTGDQAGAALGIPWPL
jgi:hypothetical protein